jgi:hypothetical protein
MLIPLTALGVIVVLALLIVQLGANALVLTGMSQSAARFQASSAFFGVGFTTREAEMVVDHPVRRRIILHLIIAGNIGITSALATLIVTMLDNERTGFSLLLLLVLVVGGALAFGLLLNVGFVKRPLDRMMKFALKRAGVIRALDYDVLLHVREGFSVSEVELWEGHPYAGLELRQSRPSDAGIVVLGIHGKDGRFIGAPDKSVMLHPGDVAMVYGSDNAVRRMREGTVSNG